MSAETNALDPVPTPPPSAPQARRAWWQLRRRTVLIGALLLTLVLVPIADVVARQVTERAVAGGMQRELQTQQRPDVSLGGTPFLTQLISRKLEKVTLDVQGATTCRMRMERMHTELRGLRRSGDTVQAESVRGEVLLSYADLNSTLAPLRLSSGGGDQVTISAGGSFLGASATGLPRIESGHLVIEPVNMTATFAGQQWLDGDLSSFPEMRIPLREIPQNLNVRLAPTAEGLRVTYDGNDVRIDTSSCPTS
jgi:hypothetical protein